ncbi:MAG: DsrE family protein [Candidatus Eremiobacteraeota bacterium]|nr:DsrE family protein [Candidatus Eremiobacteraeota bacterium]
MRLAFVAVLLACTMTSAVAAGKVHKLAIQVDANDAAIMNLALNNAANVSSYYDGQGDSVQIEIVAYGPGLHMLRDDTSPVKERLKSFKAGMPNVTFSACNVTKTGMEKTEGHPIAIVSEARLVPSGAVRLIELQESGYSYLKP